MDEWTKSTSCIRATRRWPMNKFYNFLDMICLDSYVSYTIAIDRNIRRKESISQLVEFLCKEHSIKRLSISSLPTLNWLNILKLYPEFDGLQVSKRLESKPGRSEKCDLCVGKYTPKKYATWFCFTCNKKVCIEHQQEVVLKFISRYLGCRCSGNKNLIAVLVLIYELTPSN